MSFVNLSPDGPFTHTLARSRSPEAPGVNVLPPSPGAAVVLEVEPLPSVVTVAPLNSAVLITATDPLVIPEPVIAAPA